MQDAIAELGLDSKQFVKGVDDAISQLEALKTAAGASTKEVGKATSAYYKFGEAIGKTFKNVSKAVLAGLGIGSLVSFAGKVANAREETEKLNAEIDKIGVDRSAPQFRTLDELETRLGRINDALGKLTSGAKGGVGGHLDTAGDIVGEMFGNALEGKFQGPSKTAQDIANRRDSQQRQLEEEKQRAQVQIEFKKEQARLDKEGEARNNRAWKNREAALKEEEKQIEKNRKRLEEYEKFKTDLLIKEYEQIQKNRDAANKADRERLESIKELAKANAEAAKEARNENIVRGLESSGQSLAADEEAIRQDFTRRISDAKARGSDKEVAELEEMERREMNKVKAAMQRQTPGERRAERRAAKEADSDAAKQEMRDQELIERGKRGAKSRAITEAEERAARAGKADKERETVKPGDEKGLFSADDKANLKACAEALKYKD